MTIWDTKIEQRLELGRNGDEPDNYALAIHEASHAIVAHVLGYTITGVAEDHTDRIPKKSWTPDQEDWRETVVKLASFCAVARLHDKSEGYATSVKIIKDLECFYDDFYEVFKIHVRRISQASETVAALPVLNDTTRRDRALCFGMALREAMEIVNKYWSDIEKLAHAFMDSSEEGLKGAKLNVFLPAQIKK